MSRRSEARAERSRRHLASEERRAGPQHKVSARFNRWRRIVANLPAALAAEEINRMAELINGRIRAMEGGDGK